MTYRQFAEKVLAMPQEKQDLDMSVLSMGQGEIHPVIDFVTDWADKNETFGIDMVDGVLDDGHPFITTAA